MTDQQDSPKPLDSETVAAYLRLHPEFFIDHEELIPELRIPHQSGNADLRGSAAIPDRHCLDPAHAQRGVLGRCVFAGRTSAAGQCLRLPSHRGDA